MNKKIAIIVGCVAFLFLSIFIFVASDPDNYKTQQTSQEVINIAPQEVVQQFTEGVLSYGYKIQGNIYYTKSKDFNKLYFFGALVSDKRNEIYNAIWVNNEENASGMFESVNDYAQKVSGIIKSSNITSLDDGYSRINQKLLDDWNKSYW